jgi:lysophospholipase L1-like esterase
VTTVLFVGDSITVGAVGYKAGKSDGSSFRGGVSRALGWTGVGPFSDPNGLLHGGVGGSTTETFLSGAAQWVVTGGEAPSWMDTYKPDIVVVMLGVNDVISNPSVPPIAEAMKNLDTLASFAHAQSMRPKNKRAKILISTIVEAGPEWYAIGAHAFNAKLLSMDWSASDVQSIDGCKLYNDTFWKEKNTEGLTVDGTHPNQRGYDLIAQGMVSLLGAQAQPESSTGQRLLAAGAVGFGAYLLGKWVGWF